VKVHGQNGTIVLEGGHITAWKLADAESDEELDVLALEKAVGSGASDPTTISYELHRRQIADMIDAVRNNRPPAIEGSEARKALEIILAVYQSTRSGHPVRLESS
jgi:predicted dehydrogenase